MRQTKTSDALRESKVRVAKDGGFVIPRTLRDALGIKTDDEIVMSLEDGELYITKRSRTLNSKRIRVSRARP